MTQIRASQIRASQIRSSQIRATEISSNHRELHGAIFYTCLLISIHTLISVGTATTFTGVWPFQVWPEMGKYMPGYFIGVPGHFTPEQKWPDTRASFGVCIRYTGPRAKFGGWGEEQFEGEVSSLFYFSESGLRCGRLVHLHECQIHSWSWRPQKRSRLAHANLRGNSGNDARTKLSKKTTHFFLT